MELLETALQDSIIGKGKKLDEVELSSYIEKDCNLFISTLFNNVHQVIEAYPKTRSLKNINYCFDYLEIAKNNPALDKELLQKKISKLEKRITQIKKEKLKNRKKDLKNLNNFLDKLEQSKNYYLEEEVEQDFINYLIKKPRELSYIDILFDKMPRIMKIKDTAGISLYQNIINKYLECIEDDNLEEIEYYKNLLLLIDSKKDYELVEKDKINILNNIYNNLNKKNKKINSDKIKALEELKNLLTKNKTKDIEQEASKYNIEINFNKSILESLANKKINLNKSNNRKRINDYIISIDNENAIEIDDALSCVKLENGHYLLGVHIASILGYFDYYSNIVQNAFNRVNSIYLHIKKNSIIPIFPLEFSAGFGSLKENKERLTRSYLFEIDKNGNIINQNFIKSIIVNNKQSTYDEINDILLNGSSDTKLNETVTNLKEITKILRKKYSTNEVYEMIKESSEDDTKLKVKRYGSQDIVYQSMLLTGNKVAEFFAENNYPCLYRVHRVSPQINEKIESLINSLIYNYGGSQKQKLYCLLNDIYPKSTYDIEGEHAGLQLKNYCHCTSGLRRSADILIEHALEVCYDKKPTKEELINLKNEILEKKKIITTKESSINLFLKDINKNLKLTKHQ